MRSIMRHYGAAIGGKGAASLRTWCRGSHRTADTDFAAFLVCVKCEFIDVLNCQSLTISSKIKDI